MQINDCDIFRRVLRELRKEKGCYQANEEKLLARKTVACCLLCTVNRAESSSRSCSFPIFEST